MSSGPKLTLNKMIDCSVCSQLSGHSLDRHLFGRQVQSGTIPHSRFCQRFIGYTSDANVTIGELFPCRW